MLDIRYNTFMRNGFGELCRKAVAGLIEDFDDNIIKILGKYFVGWMKVSIGGFYVCCDETLC